MACTLGVGVTGGAEAQTSQAGADSTAAPGLPPAGVAMWAAGAHNQPLSTRLGRRSDRGLFVLGIGKRRPIARSGNGLVTLSYAADLLPLVISSGMPGYSATPCPGSGGTAASTCVVLHTQLHTAYAVGVIPLGFAARIQPTARLGLQLRASGGVLYFSQPIPDPAERRLNFTGDAGGTADLALTKQLALTFGTRWNHISNAGTGPVNPGMNSWLREVGIALAR